MYWTLVGVPCVVEDISAAKAFQLSRYADGYLCIFSQPMINPHQPSAICVYKISTQEHNMEVNTKQCFVLLERCNIKGNALPEKENVSILFLPCYM